MLDRLVTSPHPLIPEIKTCLFDFPFSSNGFTPTPFTCSTMLSSYHSQLPPDWSACCSIKLTLLILPLFVFLSTPRELATLGRLHIRAKCPITPEFLHFSVLASHDARWFCENSNLDFLFVALLLPKLVPL